MNTTISTNRFSEKNVFQSKCTILGLKMALPHNFESALQILFEILYNQRGKEVHGDHISDVSGKNLIWDKWTILGLRTACNLLHGTYINGFPKKMGYFGLKMAHYHNSRLNFCIMKGAKMYVKFILMVFQKKKVIGQVDHFGPENDVISQFWIHSNFFSILRGGRRYMKLGLMVNFTWFG